MIGRIFAVSWLAVVAASAVQRSPLDAPIPGGVRFFDPTTLVPCDVAAPLHQIAHQAHLLYGFENTPDCRPSRISADPFGRQAAMTAPSARDALNQITSLVPAFSWKEVDDVIVVRPAAAWSDARDVLNVSVARFAAHDRPLDIVLHTLLRAATPSLLQAHDDIGSSRRVDAPVQLTFDGGTVLSALNALIAARGDAMWQIGFNMGRGPDHRQRAIVSVATLDLSGGTVSAPILLPPER